MAFLDAAASSAIEELLNSVHGWPRSREEACALLKIWRLVAEKQTDALAFLDRFVLHACELGLDQDATADLRRGRVSLSESLGIILGEIAHAERLLGSPLDR